MFLHAGYNDRSFGSGILSKKYGWKFCRSSKTNVFFEIHCFSRNQPKKSKRVFADLVADRLPALSAHLSSVGLPILLVALPWFLCLFIGYVPLECALRVVDR